MMNGLERRRTLDWLLYGLPDGWSFRPAFPFDLLEFSTEPPTGSICINDCEVARTVTGRTFIAWAADQEENRAFEKLLGEMREKYFRECEEKDRERARRSAELMREADTKARAAILETLRGTNPGEGYDERKRRELQIMNRIPPEGEPSR